MKIDVYHTPYREGYFMSAEDQRAAKADLILKYSELKERYALLKRDTDSIANALERGAKVLKEHPERWEFDGDDAPLKEYKNLGVLIEDVKNTRQEMQNLRALAAQGGFESLLPS
jgi:hypothetical protein